MSATTAMTLPAHELHDVVSWIDARVRDLTGRRLGRVSAVVADEHGTPWWIVVRSRGRDLVAPVASVYDTRHRELMLDRTADALAPCPTDLDRSAHQALVERFGLLPEQPATPAAPRGPRDACTPRPVRRFRRGSA